MSEVKRLRAALKALGKKAQDDFDAAILNLNTQVMRQDEVGITPDNALVFLRTMRSLYNEAMKAGAALAEIDGEGEFRMQDNNNDVLEHIVKLVSLAKFE
jgi:hypothetical protein